MAKIILDYKGEPKKDDLLIFDGKQWVTINKTTLTNDIYLKLKEDKHLITEIDKKLNDTIIKVNEKLKGYYNILQVIAKEKI